MTAPPLHLLHPALTRRAQPFVDAGVLEATDLYVVDAVAERFAESDAEVLLGLAFAVRAPRAGHVGVDLLDIQGRIDSERWQPKPDEPAPPLRWPEDTSAWQRRVLASGLVGTTQERKPFVYQPLQDGRVLVMARRMWREQERLALALRELSAAPAGEAQIVGADALDAGLAQLFSDTGSEAAQAVRVAATRRLAVITGGPGTGKTYSIKRLLALLLSLHGERVPPLRIELAAPTGKAAVRMAEAMAERLHELATTEPVRDRLRSLTPRTLHKLLGVRPDGSVRHDAEQPIPADVIVVDEASMVDLTLMRRLVEAVAPGARLILLGDRDQLASVEAGTVLADLVSGALAAQGAGSDGLAASVVRFTESRRFAEAPTIAHIAADLQRGDEASRGRALERLCRPGKVPVADETLPDRVHHLDAPVEGRPTATQLDALAGPYLDGYVLVIREAFAAHGPASQQLTLPAWHRLVLEAFAQYRVLAVHRRGPLGVAGLETALAKRVKAMLTEALAKRQVAMAGTAALAAGGPPETVHLPTKGGAWLGQPLLITENAYEVGLMNGDIGLVLPTAQGLAAVFPVTVEGKPATRAVPLVQLPAHQGALAMTVHKSQGSQFQRVALVLAAGDSPIQTRELVYTGITRSSHRLDWLGSEADLKSALARRVARASGLGELLWGPPWPR